MIAHLENADLEKTIEKGTYLVDFYADWCGPCKMMGKVLEKVDFVDVVKVNTDMRPDLAQKYGVMSIPTLIVFKDGKECNRSVGFVDIEQIKNML